MKDKIYFTVNDVISEYEDMDYLQVFSRILSHIQLFEPEIIEEELTLQKKINEILQDDSEGRVDPYLGLILQRYDKSDLEEYLTEFLDFRVLRSELFDNYNPELGDMNNIILENFLILKNPFMHSHKLYFKGELDLENYELMNDSKKKSIILNSDIPDKVYANVDVDDRVLIKGLLRCEGEKWYIFGKLEFDPEQGINTINVLRIIYQAKENI